MGKSSVVCDICGMRYDDDLVEQCELCRVWVCAACRPNAPHTVIDALSATLDAWPPTYVTHGPTYRDSSDADRRRQRRKATG